MERLPRLRLATWVPSHRMPSSLTTWSLRQPCTHTTSTSEGSSCVRRRSSWHCYLCSPSGFGCFEHSTLAGVRPLRAFRASCSFVMVPCIPTSPVPGLAYDGCGVIAVGLAALGTLPEWTIDGTVEDVGVFSRRVPNRGRVTLALLPRSCLPHIYRFEAPTDPFKVH